MSVKQTKWSYDLDKCLVELDGLHLSDSDMCSLWQISGDGSTQTCLQRNPRIWSGLRYTDGAGSFRGTDKTESDYNVLNEMYEGTIFEDIIQDLDGVRSRIMTKKMHTTYSVHKDKTPRYHLALITNPNAYFIFPTLNEIMHIPADGFVYEVDTTLPHSFVNCGEDRTHLVISKRSSS
jgi:hypothetical protein